MMEVLFFLVYGGIMSGIIGLGYVLQRRKEKCYAAGLKKVSIEQISVIIPFRNEATRLAPLLESILKSSNNPKEYVFVDDHSDDGSADMIRKKVFVAQSSMVELNPTEEGKKVAIRHGIRNSSGRWILSMDADVHFQSEYYSALSTLEEADMYVLPAVMVAKRWHEHLYEVDLILVNAANCGLAGWKRPIMASGANLLYRRSAFDQFDDFERHAHMPSGDDIYLLRDFRERAAEVRLMTDPTLAIHTETPQTFNEFIHQRLRWLAKTGDVKDHLSTSLAIIQAVLTFSFVALLIAKGIQKDWSSFWIIFCLKTGIDMLLFFPYFQRIQRLSSWFFIPLYEFLFPFYTLLILSMMYWFKPKWKGRKLQRNF